MFTEKPSADEEYETELKLREETHVKTEAKVINCSDDCLIRSRCIVVHNIVH